MFAEGVEAVADLAHHAVRASTVFHCTASTRQLVCQIERILAQIGVGAGRRAIDRHAEQAADFRAFFQILRLGVLERVVRPEMFVQPGADLVDDAAFVTVGDVSEDVFRLLTDEAHVVEILINFDDLVPVA